MIRTPQWALAAVLTMSAFGAGAASNDTTVTWTGWFSDQGCAGPRVERGDIGPNGTACIKRCLHDGATPVFISEQARAMYEVKDYRAVIDDVGYHVELTGVVDQEAKTIAVRSVKRLSEVVQMCALPKKK